MFFSSSFREKQLRLEAELPVGTTPAGRHHVVEGFQLKIDRQLAQLDDFANTAANRHSPTLVAGGLPIRCNDRRCGDIPAMREVVVNERLGQVARPILIGRAIASAKRRRRRYRARQTGNGSWLSAEGFCRAARK